MADGQQQLTEDLPVNQGNPQYGEGGVFNNTAPEEIIKNQDAVIKNNLAMNELKQRQDALKFDQYKASLEQLKNQSLDTADIASQDRPQITKEIQDYMDWTKKNPQSLDASSENLPLALERQDKFNAIKDHINTSKADQTWGNHYNAAILAHPEWGTDTNKAIQSDFWSKPLGQRQYTELNAPDTYNPMTYVGEMDKDDKLNDLTTKTFKNQGTQTITTETTQPFLTQLYNAADGSVDNVAHQHFEAIKKDPVLSQQQIPIYDDKSTVNKNGELIPSGHVPAKDATEQQMQRAQIVPIRWHQAISQTAATNEGALQEQKESATKVNKQVIVPYEQGISFNQTMNPTGSSTNATVPGEGSTVAPVSTVGGYNLSKTNSYPKDVSFESPQTLFNLTTGQQYPGTSGAMRGDIVGVYDVNVDKNGLPATKKEYQANPADYHTERMAQVLERSPTAGTAAQKSLTGRQYLVPYDNVKQQLINSKINLEDNNNSTPQETKTIKGVTYIKVNGQWGTQ
jgi:hypothetical protein